MQHQDDWITVILLAGEQSSATGKIYAGAFAHLVHTTVTRLAKEGHTESLRRLSLLGMPKLVSADNILHRLWRLTKLVPPLVEERKVEGGQGRHYSVFWLTESGRRLAEEAAEILPGGEFEEIGKAIRAVYPDCFREAFVRRIEGTPPKRRPVINFKRWEEYFRAVRPTVEEAIRKFITDRPEYTAKCSSDHIPGPPCLLVIVGLRSSARKNRAAVAGQIVHPYFESEKMLTLEAPITWMDAGEQQVPGAFAAELENRLGLLAQCTRNGAPHRAESLVYELRARRYSEEPPPLPQS